MVFTRANRGCPLFFVGNFVPLPQVRSARQDWNRCPVVEFLFVDGMECSALENRMGVTT